jgi:hypothetical protein
VEEIEVLYCLVQTNVEGKEGRGGDVFHTGPHFPIDTYMGGNIDENTFVR